MTPFKKASYDGHGRPPWSKLQKAVYLVLAPGLPLQIQCRVYPMDAVYGTTGIPRYWITLGKEIIWDYPKQFVGLGYLKRHLPHQWPYATDISEISCLIREYLDTPRNRILSEPFEHDIWGIVDILRAMDRRVGSRQWEVLKQSTGSEAATKILAWREARHTVGAKAAEGACANYVETD